MKSWENDKIIKDFKWYYDKGYITARDGNACYLDGDHYVVTASGSQKHKLINMDFVCVGLDEKKVESYNNAKPSIETGAHIAALKQSGKNASVHVHSPNTVALAQLFEYGDAFRAFRPQGHHFIDILNSRWPELFRYTRVGPIVQFREPGSKELHRSIENNFSYWTEEFTGSEEENNLEVKEVKKFNDIVIMQRHGVLTIGDDFDQCMEHIVRLEHVSTILLKIISASGKIESIL